MTTLKQRATTKWTILQVEDNAYIAEGFFWVLVKGNGTGRGEVIKYLTTDDILKLTNN